MFYNIRSNDHISSGLTSGLGRNTFYNVIGWLWPMGLSFLIVPYLLSILGSDCYGILGITSIVAGYIGVLNGSIATGNVRFMAEAYGRQDWNEFRNALVLGVLVVGLLSAAGAVLIFVGADFLAGSVFKIPGSLVGKTKIVFRLTALSFLLNGVASGLSGILSAIRRYDVLNLTSLGVGTLNGAGVVFAVWSGWGITGAVAAQVISSAIGALAFFALGFQIWSRIPQSSYKVGIDGFFIKRLVSFSLLIFGGGLASTIGLRVDRTIVGMLLGTSSVTYYIVPAKITEQIPSLLGRLTLALYPLSAEGAAKGQMEELRSLYTFMIRMSLIASGVIAIAIISSAGEFLCLWIGPDMAKNSWLVLTLLAASVIWRGPGTVAYQVGNGLGRGDLYLGVSVFILVSCGLLVLALTLSMGITGAALGMLMGLALGNFLYDILTQRRLFGQRDWLTSVDPYFRAAMAITATVICSGFWPSVKPSWSGLVLKTCFVILIYFFGIIFFGLTKVEELRIVAGQIRNALYSRT